MISALLVALIVTATFNGLDVATRFSKDQRHHDQAQILAAQSQEQLRTEPASALDVLESNPHKYSIAIGGETYTITQEAKAVSASGSSTGCSATEATAQTGANILVSSRVSWPQQVAAKRPEVKQASLITPPTGSALEVDVINGEGGGVSGVTARAKFIPNEAGSYNTVEGTTGPAGCVVLTGIQSTAATVEIVEKAGFVTPSGALKVEPKELTIAPNITTHYAVEYAEGGRIAAQYTYEGATTYGGKEVKGESFVAFNSETKVKPEFETGAAGFEYEGSAEEAYRRSTSSRFAATNFTAAGAKYSAGRLFPFKAGWTVYAGDCPANNVEKGDEVGGVIVKSGSTTTVKVPLSYTKLSIYTGVSSSLEPGELTKETSGGNVKIINTSCSSAEEPINAYNPYYTHEQTETLAEGRLENPFQPFGNFQLCVDWKKSKAYTVSYTNAKAAGSAPKIYLKQKTTAEKTAEITAENEAKAKREAEEATAKSAKEKREKEETEAKTAKEKRVKEESEMASAKTARETKEAEERAKWKKEVEKKENGMTETKRKEKETAQTNARIAKEAEEKTAKEKRTSEESAAATAKTKRETEESEAKTAKTKREAEETAAKTAKETREKRETAEATNGVTVEAKEKC